MRTRGCRSWLGPSGGLRCVRDYPQQKAAGNFSARRANVEGAFRAVGVPPRHVVMVDDI